MPEQARLYRPSHQEPNTLRAAADVQLSELVEFFSELPRYPQND